MRIRAEVKNRFVRLSPRLRQGRGQDEQHCGAWDDFVATDTKSHAVGALSSREDFKSEVDICLHRLSGVRVFNG